METALPVRGSMGRVALTGFGNAVQLPGGKCSTVMIQARVAVAGLSGGASTNNSDYVLIGIGSAPTATTSYVGVALAPGEMSILAVDDLSMIYVDGANGDSITYAILR